MQNWTGATFPVTFKTHAGKRFSFWKGVSVYSVSDVWELEAYNILSKGHFMYHFPIEEKQFQSVGTNTTVRKVRSCSLSRKGVITWQMNPSLETTHKRRNKIWLAKIGMFLIPFICSSLSFVTGKSLYPTHLSSSILNPWNYASGSGIDCFSKKAFWRWISIPKTQTSSRDENSNFQLCCS